jgi:DUF4097 and DUF4098 domain-containing protein YvlB
VFLILIGTLFLAQHLVGISIWLLFARWWPAFLILAGLIKIAEYEWSRRSGNTGTHIGGGATALLVLIIIFGLISTGVYKMRDQINWGEVRDEVQVDDDFLKIFGSEHQFDSELTQDFPANGSLKVVCDRGGVTVNVNDDNRVRVVAHKRIFASNNNEAERRNNDSQPTFSINGTQVVLNANTRGGDISGIRTDLELFVPRNAALEISTRKGDVAVTGRTGTIRVSNNRGDVTLEDVTGDVYVTMDRGSTRATKVTGLVSVEGKGDDIALSDISGPVRINGDFFGDIRFAKIDKGVHFTSARTDLEVGKLDGELNLDKNDLRLNDAAGPVAITSRSKDIDIRGINGELRISNDSGEIAIESAGTGNIDVTSRHGGVKLQFPAKAGFSVNAVTRKGEVQSDFDSLKLTNPDHGDSTATGTVGKGGVKVQVTNDFGDIEIRKAG